MSSENESKTQQTKFGDRRAKIERLIDEYTASIGLKIRPSSEVEKYLNLTQEEVRRMTAEECGEASYIIAKAMTFIQLEVNKVQADINWCESYIQFVVSKTIQNVGTQYMPFDYKKMIAIRQDDTAMQANKVIVEAKIKIDTLSFVSNQLRMVAQAFDGLQQTKRSQK